MFFEDVEVSADILIETPGVGAGLALRVRNSRFFRGVTPGLYLFIGEATPGIPVKKNPNDPGAGEPGGIPPSPNVPMDSTGNSFQWKLCTNSWCDGHPIANGSLPATWLVGEWHSLALMVVNGTATANMDGQQFYHGGTIAPPQPQAALGSCESNMTILPDGEMLVGYDYRQTQMQSDPSDVEHCVQDCCADPKCVAWAVAVSGEPTSPTCTKGTACCFLKNGISAITKGTGEISAGMKPRKPSPAQPPLPFGGVVPSSGWAALVTTLGGVQYANFKLEGKAAGGGAVAACGSEKPAAGSSLVSTPCDAPNALSAWEKLPGGQLQLRSTTLCIGAAVDGAAVLAPCAVRGGSPNWTHNHTTGLVGDGSACIDIVDVTVTGWPGKDGMQWPAAVADAKCAVIPSNQQFQWNPQTGALRPKGSTCVAGFAGTVNEYRDCCLSVCGSSAASSA
jgi:hypothetical protein